MVAILRLTFASLFIIASGLPVAAAESNPEISAAAKGVKQLIAHRGSSIDRPENTLASTRRAIEARATAIEVDVRLTKDGQLVLRHDDALDRTTNGQGRVREKTLAELKQLDAGTWFGPRFAGERIPTLAEVLALCRDKTDVLLDLKESGDDFARLVSVSVQEHGNEPRTIVGVRSVEQARQFRKLLPKARQLGLIGTPDEIESYADAGVETIRLWPKWLADESLVRRVRQCKCGLHLNGISGERDEVVGLLRHYPESLSSDAPAQLVKTLAELRKRE